MSVRRHSAAALVLLALAGPAVAQTAAPAAAGVQAPADPAPATRRSRQRDTATKREPSVRQMIAMERRRKCSVEWKTAKAAGKVAEGLRWPKFYSQCNARLKGSEV